MVELGTVRARITEVMERIDNDIDTPAGPEDAVSPGLGETALEGGGARGGHPAHPQDHLRGVAPAAGDPPRRLAWVPIEER